jgi:hypothetical protein
VVVIAHEVLMVLPSITKFSTNGIHVVSYVSKGVGDNRQ